MGHTKGKWEYFEQKAWGEDRLYGCVRCGGLVIVNGCAPGGTKEANANARLIAAAPALLEACKAIVKGLGEDLLDGDPLSVLVATAERAIAEAESK